MARPPKVCLNCSGYGLLFNTMHLPPDETLEKPEQPVIYFPERQVTTVSADTLDLWKENCKKEIEVLESKKLELLGGISQIDRELVRRVTA